MTDHSDRWDRVFADLEAQVEADADRDQWAEISEHAQSQLREISLHDRLRALAEQSAQITVWVASPGSEPIQGRIIDLGQDWIRLQRPVNLPWNHITIALTGICALSPLPARAITGAELILQRRSLVLAIRELARRAARVQVLSTDGRLRIGRVRAVGADYLELNAEQQPGSQALSLAGVLWIAHEAEE